MNEYCTKYPTSNPLLSPEPAQPHAFMTLASWYSVTTMSNSGSYPVTPVASQHYSSTPVARSYSGHNCADNPLLTTTLGLVCIQSLPHLAVNPAWSWVLRVLVISPALYYFHWTWFILPRPDFIFIRPDLVLSPVIPCLPLRLFTCHRKYSTLVLT